MRRPIIPFAMAILVAGLVVAGCSQSAPASPTAAPAKPAAAPTAASGAPAAAPTGAAAAPAAAPAATFPQKGKAIQWIVPFSAGGSTDVQARLVAASMEKILGTPVEVVNRAGAGSQIGLQELVTAKPDGYTIGNTNNATTMGVYLMPERKASFNMDSFEKIGLFIFDAECITVNANGPYKTYKDLIDAAKAKPKTVKATTNGLYSDDHIAIANVQRHTGAQFAIVHFDGSSEEVAALLGNKTDAAFMGIGASLAQTKAGALRVLAVMDEQPSPLLPGVPTLKSLGIDYVTGSSRGLSAPKGTPKEVIKVLEGALEQAMKDPNVVQKVQDMGNAVKFLNSADYAKFWADMEKDVRPAVELMLKDQGVAAATAIPTK